MLGNHRNSVRNFLQASAPSILSAFTKSLSHPNLTLSSLRGILTLLSWGARFPVTKSIPVHLGADVVRALFEIAGRSNENVESVAAVMCLNETVENHKWNPHNPRLMEVRGGGRGWRSGELTTEFMIEASDTSLTTWDLRA